MNKFAFVCISAGALMLAQPAQAAPFVASAPVGQSVVQLAHWHGVGWHGGWRGPGVGLYLGGVGVGYGAGYGYGYGGCGGVRHMCANRWGWGGPGFGRCLWRHGC